MDVGSPFDQFANALKRYPAGSEVDLAIFRRGYLVHVAVTTGTAPPEKLLIRPVDDRRTARPRDLRIVARDAVDAPCQGGRANCSVNYGTPGERCAGPAKSSPRTLRVNPQTTWPSWWTDGSSSGPWGVGRIIGTGWPRAS